MNPACEQTPVTSLTNAIRELSRGQTKAGGEIMHIIYTARQGLPPAVRALIEHIVAQVAACDAEVRAAALNDPLGAFHPENAKS